MAEVLETIAQLQDKAGNVIKLGQRIEEDRVRKQVAYQPAAKGIE